MCGRTGLNINKDSLRCACSYKPHGKHTFIKPEWSEEHNDGKSYSPSYNIAPTDVTPVLISASGFRKDLQTTDRLLKPMMWGMVPPWHKGDYKNHNLSTNNCRLESIRSSKLYSPALNDGGRCVIVVEGFYEWQTTNKTSKNKQPYYIYAPQENTVEVDNPETWHEEYSELTGWKGIKLLYLAGLYSVWKNEGVVLYCYSVITMDSNTTLDWLHHRMPAVLDTEEKVQAWLDVTNVNVDMALSHLQPVTVLSWHPVSALVNNSRNKNTDCNKRISLETKADKKQKTLTMWFKKAEKRKSNEDTESPVKKLKH